MEINWSEVARQSFREKLTDLEFFEEFKSRSELTEEEAIELGKKVNLRIRKLRRSVTRSKKVSLEGMDQSNEICYRF